MNSTGAERAYILGLAETDAAIRAFNKWSRADGDAGLLPLLPPSIISRWAQAFQKRETIFLNNPETLRATHPDEYAFWREHGIRSYFLIPFDGETDGVRYFGIVNPTQHTDEAPRFVRCPSSSRTRWPKGRCGSNRSLQFSTIC